MLKKVFVAAAVATVSLPAHSAEPAANTAPATPPNDKEPSRNPTSLGAIRVEGGPEEEGRSEYQRLMAHWLTVLPLRTLELRYEETVKDVEAQARRLIDFLGAPWDDRCLEFHRNDRAVQTPSRWQVRQPIYSKSMERWRHYAPHLPELLRVPSA